MKKALPYLFLALLLTAMPLAYWDRLRSLLVALLPSLTSSSTSSDTSTTQLVPSDERALLQVENQQLRQLITHQMRLLERGLLLSHALTDADPTSGLRRHQAMLERALSHQLEGTLARLAYRPQVGWSSALWIDLGFLHNEEMGFTAIALNSPVLANGSLVGLVDQVGSRQSRVRLISDPALPIAVRVARGKMADLQLAEELSLLRHQLQRRPDLIAMAEIDGEQLYLQLERLSSLLQQGETSQLLAKGELQGCSQLSYRHFGQLLRGVGFNYDFGDEEGPARELRSGIAEGGAPASAPVALVRIDDLLVTSGLDGLFPPALPVAQVTSIRKLGEGDYYYELEAQPTAGNLDQLSLFLVLPPMAE